ncbi:hypothetical protein CPB84DRAFT_1406661 [Gymnopilus junonius]|uniref:Zinc-finger domain-containing protein n=1 Tax=Gymnopilus junonius TaxID=109634 RepID=A0A9P5NL05_GYMJU|nr:hypothetical protein CPB84DRAFT_1406661 [Gymnopilus junonius]
MKRLSTLPVLPKQDERKSEITSAANDNNDHRAFEFYQSLFESYPLLLSQTRSMDLSSHFHDMSSQSLSHMYPFMRPSLSSDSPHVYTEPSSSYSSSTSSAGIALPNLQPLKVAALAKVLNPTQRLCQYEVPGGGTCRDDGCRDVHLNRLEGEMGAAEPSDEDTADYLFNILPQRWLQQRHVTSSFRIFSSLQQVRQQNLNNPLRLEERVTQVLDSFGPPPT